MSLTSNHQPEVIDELNGRIFVEALPARKSSKHSGIRWQPLRADDPAAGVLTIDTDRARVTYVLCEFPPGAGWDGRAFHLAKLDEGTDRDNEAYDVFCGRGGEYRCDCKGFAYQGHCKHGDSCLALIDNRWV